MGAPVTIGSVFAGKYRIERVLGAGGMGVVFAAVHVHLGERVAIKFLNPEAMTDSTTLARFFREGQAAAKVRSEHVARVYDVGTLGTGAPYLVMEHLEGEDLATILKHRGPLPISEAVVYVLQACEAIAEAHARGIVHRDIKPGNLFVTLRPDGSPVVKVIDFGISKVAEAYGPGLAVTATTEVRGSPLFMSPEQLLATRDADARSDIWSLGVSLFNLLTKAYPFPAPTLPALYDRVLHGKPVPLRSLRPEAPVELEAAILRCLCRSASARFASVAELARALGVYAPGQAEISIRRIEAVQPTHAAPRVERAERAMLVEPAPRLSGGTARLVAGTPERDSRTRRGTEVVEAGGAVAKPSPHAAPRAPRALSASLDGPAASATRGDPAEPPLPDTWSTTRKRPSRRGRAVVIAACLASAFMGLFVSLFVVLRPSLESTSSPPTRSVASRPSEASGAAAGGRGVLGSSMVTLSAAPRERGVSVPAPVPTRVEQPAPPAPTEAAPSEASLPSQSPPSASPPQTAPSAPPSPRVAYVPPTPTPTIPTGVPTAKLPTQSQPLSKPSAPSTQPKPKPPEAEPDF